MLHMELKQKALSMLSRVHSNGIDSHLTFMAMTRESSFSIEAKIAAGIIHKNSGERQLRQILHKLVVDATKVTRDIVAECIIVLNNESSELLTDYYHWHSAEVLTSLRKEGVANIYIYAPSVNSFYALTIQCDSANYKLLDVLTHHSCNHYYQESV